MAYKVKVYAFSNTGRETAKKIAEIKTDVFRGEKLVFEESYNSIIDENRFKDARAHIFVGAIGIAVRKIAPYIKDKKTDPAVIVVDEKGQFVIPVLSGHIGGANRLSTIVANELNATAVITTATDVNGYNAIDLLAADNRLSFIYSCNQNVNDRILKHEKIKVFIDKDIDVIKDNHGIYEISDLSDCDVHIINDRKYIIGTGCKKNTDKDIFEQTLDSILNEYGISHSEIDRICSIDKKENEEAIVKYANKNNIMYETYSSLELESVKGDFDKSDFVKEITGVSNVSERACAYALNLLGRGEFIVKRKVVNSITVSIMKVTKRIDLNGKS